jgi:anti-sigma factor RsiW
MKRGLELKLQAWVDGELTAAEAEEMRRLADADPDAARLAAELQSIKTAFAGDSQPVTMPETREFYWSKIEQPSAPRPACGGRSGSGAGSRP